MSRAFLFCEPRFISWTLLVSRTVWVSRSFLVHELMVPRASWFCELLWFCEILWFSKLLGSSNFFGFTNSYDFTNFLVPRTSTIPLTPMAFVNSFGFPKFMVSRTSWLHEIFIFANFLVSQGPVWTTHLTLQLFHLYLTYNLLLGKEQITEKYLMFAKKVRNYFRASSFEKGGQMSHRGCQIVDDVIFRRSIYEFG